MSGQIAVDEWTSRKCCTSLKNEPGYYRVSHCLACDTLHNAIKEEAVRSHFYNASYLFVTYVVVLKLGLVLEVHISTLIFAGQILT